MTSEGRCLRFTRLIHEVVKSIKHQKVCPVMIKACASNISSQLLWCVKTLCHWENSRCADLLNPKDQKFEIILNPFQLMKTSQKSVFIIIIPIQKLNFHGLSTIVSNDFNYLFVYLLHKLGFQLIKPTKTDFRKLWRSMYTFLRTLKF